MFKNTPRKEVEQTLATSLQQGQPEVLALLYDAYAPVLLGLITRMVRDPQIAEPVLQETFLAIWQQRATYNAEQSGLLTWMIMVAKDTALAALQSKKYSSASTNGNLSPAVQTAEENNNARQLEILVKKSFHQLEPTEKAALDLIYLKGCSSAEAATILGISEEALKINLRMAIKHLRADKP